MYLRRLMQVRTSFVLVRITAMPYENFLFVKSVCKLICLNSVFPMQKFYGHVSLMAQSLCTSFSPLDFSQYETCCMHYSVQFVIYVSTTSKHINPYPTAFPYGNGMVLHFYQQQESSMTKTVHKVINKGLKTYV